VVLRAECRKQTLSFFATVYGGRRPLHVSCPSRPVQKLTFTSFCPAGLEGEGEERGEGANVTEGQADSWTTLYRIYKKRVVRKRDAFRRALHSGSPPPPLLPPCSPLVVEVASEAPSTKREIHRAARDVDRLGLGVPRRARAVRWMIT